jgi:signal transduction histidine kinase
LSQVAGTVKAMNIQDRRERELVNLRDENSRLRQRLILLSNLGRRIASSLDPDTVLQRVIDSACELTEARYGALGVFDVRGRVEKFITHGLTQEERERIGALPEGLGILGWLQDLQEPLRLGDLTSHPRSVGFPSDHPPMKTFLGAPVRNSDEPIGNIYLTEKANGADFTPEDESLLVLFAAQAAMAIRNAQLHGQVQDLVALEERERIGMDLHDGVIQSLYATGLKLEASLEDVAVNPDLVKPELEKSIDQLNQVIADIRSYIFQLRPAMLADADLAGAVGGLLRQLQVNALTNVKLIEQPGSCDGLTEEQTNALFLIAQEALTNVRKHANAAQVTAELARTGGTFKLTITDDGSGFDPGQRSNGQGLRNMQERVKKFGGHVTVQSAAGHGSSVLVSVPVAQEEAIDG